MGTWRVWTESSLKPKHILLRLPLRAPLHVPGCRVSFLARGVRGLDTGHTAWLGPRTLGSRPFSKLSGKLRGWLDRGDDVDQDAVGVPGDEVPLTERLVP